NFFNFDIDVQESSMESINEDNTILEVPTAYTYPSVYGVTNTVKAKGGYDQTPNIFLNPNHYFAYSEEESKGKKLKVHDYDPNVTFCRTSYRITPSFSWILGKLERKIPMNLKSEIHPLMNGSRKFNLEFGDEIKQLVDEYKLRIRKKGDTLQEIWDKYGEVSDDVRESWYEDGFEEEEKRECSMLGIPYDPSKVMLDAYEFKQYFLVSKINVTRFKVEIRKDMDATGCVQRAT
ncbi:hypothetical protein Tco_1418975, partial [Tanacetum coccineum]